MASYCLSDSVSDQGIRNIQDTVKRGDAAIAEAKKNGMKIVENTGRWALTMPSHYGGAG